MGERGFCVEADEADEADGATDGADRGAAGGGAIEGARGAIGAFDTMRFVAGGGMLTGDLLTGARSASACAMSGGRPCAVAASS